jgi:hypothetical protein
MIVVRLLNLYQHKCCVLMLYIARLFYISKHSLDVFTARQCLAVKEREMQSSMNHSSVGESVWIHEVTLAQMANLGK